MERANVYQLYKKTVFDSFSEALKGKLVERHRNPVEFWGYFYKFSDHKKNVDEKNMVFGVRVKDHEEHSVNIFRTLNQQNFFKTKTEKCDLISVFKKLYVPAERYWLQRLLQK